MSDQKQEIVVLPIRALENLLEPIILLLDDLRSKTSQTSSNPKPKKYYRNSDLKNLFGLSSNTIIKYRETGVLPFTKLGDIYLYEVKSIENILNQNKID